MGARPWAARPFTPGGPGGGKPVADDFDDFDRRAAKLAETERTGRARANLRVFADLVEKRGLASAVVSCDGWIRFERRRRRNYPFKPNQNHPNGLSARIAWLLYLRHTDGAVPFRRAPADAPSWFLYWPRTNFRAIARETVALGLAERLRLPDGSHRHRLTLAGRAYVESRLALLAQGGFPSLNVAAPDRGKG